MTDDRLTTKVLLDAMKVVESATPSTVAYLMHPKYAEHVRTVHPDPDLKCLGCRRAWTTAQRIVT